MFLSAAQRGQEAIVRFFLLERGIDPDSKHRQFGPMTALALAAWNGHESTVRALLESGADPDPDSDELSSETPLSLGIARGHKAIVRVLLESGADSDLDEPASETPLSIAVKRRDEAIISLLLEKGARYSGSTCQSTERVTTLPTLRLYIPTKQNNKMPREYLQQPRRLSQSSGQSNGLDHQSSSHR